MLRGEGKTRKKRRKRRREGKIVMKPIVRRLITLVCGFGIALLFMAAAIYFGYSNAYRRGTETSEVYMFGLNIYHLVLSGEKYIGTSNGPAMGGVSAIVMAVVFAVEEMIFKLRKH